jgi:cephalosporin hydroxylase
MGRFLEIAMPHADDPMSMDVGHALMIGQFIREIDATSVVEVGCCYGISTGAILDAFEEMWQQHQKKGTCELRQVRVLHLIDVKFQPTIAAMLDKPGLVPAYAKLVSIDEKPSLSKYSDDRPTLGRYYGEVVILDGDHSEENVMAEVDLVLSWSKLPRAIILHDTGRDGLPGPRAAVEYLRKKWWSIVHNETAGSRASRGLTICTADDDNGGDFFTAHGILENGK